VRVIFFFGQKIASEQKPKRENARENSNLRHHTNHVVTKKDFLWTDLLL
jgi:hypothetical protein